MPFLTAKSVSKEKGVPAQGNRITKIQKPNENDSKYENTSIFAYRISAGFHERRGATQKFHEIVIYIFFYITLLLLVSYTIVSAV